MNTTGPHESWASGVSSDCDVGEATETGLGPRGTRARPACASKARLEPLPVSSSLGGTGRGPPAHPSCICWTVWRRGRNRNPCTRSTCFTPSLSATDANSGHLALRSYQRQASSLRRWLELSREEPRPEDQEAEQQVQAELQEVRSPAAPGRALAELPLSTPPLPARRWSCRPSSWLRSSRPSASPSAPASPASRPCGRPCARAPARLPEQNVKLK